MSESAVSFSSCIHGTDELLIPRTARALIHAGSIAPVSTPDIAALASALGASSGNVAIAEAGVWFPASWPLPVFPEHGEWIAAGAWSRPHRSTRSWEKVLARTGGDLSRLSWWHPRPPLPPAMLLSKSAAHRFSALLQRYGNLADAWPAVLRSPVRVVHLAELDAAFSPALRVLEVVTSIQIGGAERVALDLAAELPRHGIAALVVALGKPTREAYPAPPGFVDLSSIQNTPEARAEALRRVALKFGADAVHAHLIRAAEARAIRGLGLPVMLHLHNLPPGWPPDYHTLQAGDATLVTGCAQAVEREMRRALPTMTTRTIWNGIAPLPPSAHPSRKDDAPFTVVILANPRGQKRLELLPAIAQATASRLAPRQVRFILAGAREPYSADSAAAMAALDAAIAAHGAETLVERPGLVYDTSALLRKADALLSVSAYEGLSLAHLEALAAGVPVVATDAGGTREIAAQSGALTVLPLDATPTQFAEALAFPPRGAANLPKSFTRHAMASRTAWFVPSVIRRAHRKPGEGLWLIANNFSTGGAQTSARRLLLALRERGLRVRAVTIQEQPEHPTPGRRALLDAGISVLAVPPAEGRAVERAAEPLLRAIERDPPQAVFFWNLITSWKVLLADALLDTRIFDISPGEMFFSSLDRFLADPPAGLPYRRAEDYGARLAGIVVKYAAESSRASQLGCPVSIIPNGVPLLPPRSRQAGQRLVLGTAARLSPDKKLAELFAALHHAAPRLPPFVVRIAGGPERDFPHHAAELRKLARGLPVEWMGELPDITGFLSSLDIFLTISEPAGCPNTTLEAMSAGLPVIATDHGGAREQVLDGLTGRLTPRNDPQAFAAALLALAEDPRLRTAMSGAARDRAETHFSMAKMADAYSALLREPEVPHGSP